MTTVQDPDLLGWRHTNTVPEKLYIPRVGSRADCLGVSADQIKTLTQRLAAFITVGTATVLQLDRTRDERGLPHLVTTQSTM